MARVAVVGAGPAGFYAAQALLRRNADISVDILERLPVPFGLVRYGIAPDHPATKNVINTFSDFMCQSRSRVRFFGNVPSLSHALPLSRLNDMYHLVVNATGATAPRSLSPDVAIDPHVSSRVRSAHEFIMWVNGHPAYHSADYSAGIAPCLRKQTVYLPQHGRVLVIGLGNVALDVARLLLRPVDDLRATDISPAALNAVEEASVQEVVVVGRRAPEYAAWTTAALRELVTKIPGILTLTDANTIKQALARNGVSRSTMRGLKLLLENAVDVAQDGREVARRQLRFEFGKSPVSFSATSRAASLGQSRSGADVEVVASFRQNIAHSTNLSSDRQQTDSEPGLFEEQCGSVLLSLGYEGGRCNPGMVSVGWANGKGRGIVGDNKWDAESVIQALPNLSATLFANANPVQKSGIDEWLRETGYRVVGWDDWERIDKEERRRAKIIHPDRERCKIESVEEMLDIAEGRQVPVWKCAE